MAAGGNSSLIGPGVLEGLRARKNWFMVPVFPTARPRLAQMKPYFLVEFSFGLGAVAFRIVLGPIKPKCETQFIRENHGSNDSV